MLKDNELVIDIPFNRNGKRVIFTTLRFRGRKAAGLVYRLKEYMNTDEGLVFPPRLHEIKDVIMRNNSSV